MQYIAYKVFGPDWTCRGYQYEVGKTYEMAEKPICYKRGFHFCDNLKDCFSCYEFNATNKVAEVEILGEIDRSDKKACTNKMRIIRELSWYEVLEMVNVGIGNTGIGNTGDYNSGDYNSGNCNTGDYNSGKYNTGNYNTGIGNTGIRNSGDCNTGSKNSGNSNAGFGNTGSRNSGDCNTGSRNSGDCNTGIRNSGDCNTGHCNNGNYNSGKYNTGNYNTGFGNTGSRNSGDWNTGHCNTGDWNACNHSSGCFNTKEANMIMFNELSDWTYSDWLCSEAHQLLAKLSPPIKWISDEEMSQEEKKLTPEHFTTGGCLKGVNHNQVWWDNLSTENKEIIKSLPNFNPEIFKKCTGIEV